MYNVFRRINVDPNLLILLGFLLAPTVAATITYGKTNSAWHALDAVSKTLFVQIISLFAVMVLLSRL